MGLVVSQSECGAASSPAMAGRDGPTSLIRTLPKGLEILVAVDLCRALDDPQVACLPCHFVAGVVYSPL